MNNVLRMLALVIVAFICAPLGGCENYDKLVDLDATCDQKWADVQSQLQRRYDLIPNLVATVKGQAKFEQDTLDKGHRSARERDGDQAERRRLQRPS